MSIRRTHLAFEDRFVQVPNEWARDKRISRKARGLLVEIMSHRDGWIITMRSLMESGPEGRDSLRSAINELVENGYLKVEQTRADRGRYSEVDYVIRDPFEPGADSPSTGFPSTVEPSTANRPPKKTITQEDQSKDQSISAEVKSKRGTRLPEGWMPSPGVASVIRGECPGLDLTREHRKFSDHFAAATGAIAVKANWDATWRNWMRRACEYAEARQGVATTKAVLDAQWAAFLNERPITHYGTGFCPSHHGYPMPCEKCRRES